jgi:16S rRNA (cytosine1402-N4)-methyltransferase
MSKNSKPYRKQYDRSEVAEFDYHLPVLAEKSIALLVNSKIGIYIDGTLGGGGHAVRILSVPDFGGNLLAFDKDPDACAFSKRKLSSYLKKDAVPSLTIYNECYSEACVKSAVWGKFSGILLDLGVSSKQLDTGSSGISYRFDSDLDMRFGTDGITAEELLNTAGLAELKKILRDYGEEPFAGLIARRIVERRRAMPIKTTEQLKELIEEITPVPYRNKTLSRVFQALRIAVNEELDVLSRTMNCIVPKMEKGGRIVVISYHSLEDRIVKNFFRENSKEIDDKTAKLIILTSKPITPDDHELAQNPRSRSAKLRAAEVI